MAQPSIACYFNARKRPAIEDKNVLSAKKVVVLDTPESEVCANELIQKKIIRLKPTKKMVVSENKNVNYKPKNGNIEAFLNNMSKTSKELEFTEQVCREETHVTPPGTPTNKTNAMDNINDKSDILSLKDIKRKLTRSARLAELKASISRFQNNAVKLKEVQEETSKILESPKLKTFRTIELEVQTSPQKIFSPEKIYLSPKKDLGARRNLFNLLSPTKNSLSISVDGPSKQILDETSRSALTLPYKYRYLAEMFRSIDIVAQILFNRKENITFSKLKSAVEDMLKRNLLKRHLAQIKTIYPEAFNFEQEKIRVFGGSFKEEHWELVIKPQVGDLDHLNSDLLLQRRRILFNRLINKARFYHDEFLSSLDPPITLKTEKLTRWHPEFDIEKIPDIDGAELPEPPTEEKLSTGKDVLEKAKDMFKCNSRMEQALQRLQSMKQEETSIINKTEEQPTSALKGIPKALLEKVRQKQAAKALLSMTRSEDKEKELKIYSRLPELIRLTRNLFVSEKKSVLPLDAVLEKLGYCYRANLSKTEMEHHLRVISKEFPTWLVFHNIRNCEFVKISKSDDVSLIINKVECLIKEKSEF